MLSVIFVILTLALVMFLVFKKVNIVIASIIASIVLAVLDRQDIITAMTETFMTGTANYVKNFFLLFFVSALFGKMMESTGAAAAIARGLANLLGEKFAILGVLIAGMVLCYGGISALVIAFTMYPLTLAVFKRANLPRRLIPGAIAAGCFTFAAAALPGTPQTINVTPIPYLGTTVIAGASIGIICGVIGIALIFVYMYWETARAKTAGDGFAADAATLEALSRADEAGAGINPLLALVPILVVIILLVGLKVNVLVSMLTGSAICILLFYKECEKYLRTAGRLRPERHERRHHHWLHCGLRLRGQFQHRLCHPQRGPTQPGCPPADFLWSHHHDPCRRGGLWYRRSGHRTGESGASIPGDGHLRRTAPPDRLHVRYRPGLPAPLRRCCCPAHPGWHDPQGFL